MMPPSAISEWPSISAAVVVTPALAVTTSTSSASAAKSPPCSATNCGA